MSTRAPTHAIGSTHTPSAPRRAPLAALIEVLLAFLLVHVLFRAIKQFTAWGKWEASENLNLTPGAVMVLFTICMLLACRRDFTQYGLTLTGWQAGLKIGLLWGLVLVTGVALLRVLGVRHEPGINPPTVAEGLIYGIAACAAMIFLAQLVMRETTYSKQIPWAASAALLLALLCAPMLVVVYYRRPFVPTLLTVSWLVLGAGCGEEVFYRGYIQSRLNETFGRPFRLFNVNFGFGLLLASFLFGFLHALNSVDYFHGRFTFAWGFCLTGIGAGLFYGCLREATGSVLASMTCHAVVDVLVIIPRLVSGT
jgi:membrane protease YdiL (CAAX protease family)